MKSKVFFLQLSLILIIAFSCSTGNEAETLVNKWELRPDVKKIIQDYVIEYPQYKTFILKVNPWIPDEFQSSFGKSYFLLGPGYEELLDYKNVYVDLKESRIYIQTGMEPLLINNNYLKREIEQVDDSIIHGNSVYRDANVNFVSRAIFFYKNEKDSFIVNSKPDTIILPKSISNFPVKFND